MCEEEDNYNDNLWEDDNYNDNLWEDDNYNNNNNEWEKWEEQNCNHSGWEEQKCNDREWEHEQHNYNEWEQEDESSLGRLYRPPYELMHKGDFHQAKADASFAHRFLLVNLQAQDEFNSKLLNRDTWSNVAVAQTIKENFVFWQVSDLTTEGKKVKTYYNLAALPAILVLNPITGEKMKSWCGVVVEPETLLENLIQFMETTPSEALRPKSKTVAESSEHEKNSRSLEQKMSELSGECPDHDKYPPLPEEPKLSEGSLVSRVRLRFPDGHRLQRNFFRTDPIQLLWSLCKSELMSKDEWRPFQLIIAVPGAFRRLDYETKLTLEEAGLLNCLVSIEWL